MFSELRIKQGLGYALPMAIKKQRRNNRDVDRSVPQNEFVIKLRRLADALEAGTPFVIQVAGERIRIPFDAVVSIEHERAGGEEELEFQLKWKRGLVR
jgi:amphi-Trp domain-containing protein